MGIEIKEFRPYQQNTLQGFVTVLLQPSGLEIRDLTYHVKDGNRWLNMPAKPYEKDGATWFRTTDFGDDKDRVVVRDNGVTTYFASDIAYHQDKFKRGFDKVIDVWGADHHGYIPRMTD